MCFTRSATPRTAPLSSQMRGVLSALNYHIEPPFRGQQDAMFPSVYVGVFTAGLLNTIPAAEIAVHTACCQCLQNACGPSRAPVATYDACTVGCPIASYRDQHHSLPRLDSDAMLGDCSVKATDVSQIVELLAHLSDHGLSRERGSTASIEGEMPTQPVLKCQV